MKRQLQALVLPVLALGIAFTSCKKESGTTMNDMASATATQKQAKGTEFYALTSTNELVKYSSGNPITELNAVSITGLQASEIILAIDFRPATGQLYGVSSQSRIYIINQNSGMASAVSTTPFSPAISGTEVGFDFNPTVDRIRLVSNTGQNLRLNPETGMLAATDVAINPAGAMVTAVAYTNSVSGATSTTLYDIDVATDKLYIQNPPNNGTLVSVGMLGVQAVGEAGFDISPDNSVAIAALYGRGYEEGQTEASNGNKYRFYYIDLATGAATNAGKTSRTIIGLAIPTNPVAYAVSGANLHIFNPTQSGGIATKPITMLPAGEMIAGIDFRPANGQLYALGSSSRLYTINLGNGQATMVGSGPFMPALSGTSYGFDFNPTVDRIRVVSNTGQNLRLNPITGGVAAIDPMLNPGTPSVDAAGYTNSTPGATTTTLYDIDYNTDMLYMQNPANAGTLVPVGALGVNINAANGFDIGGYSNTAWGIFTAGGSSALYSVDKATGAATQLMPFPVSVNGFAVGLGF
jgi:3D (Asp-Asp-Asp) domain-containing protein